jgi:hypothetical protein
MDDNMDEPKEEYLLADYVEDVHHLAERAPVGLTALGIVIPNEDIRALKRLKNTSLEDLADYSYLKIVEERTRAIATVKNTKDNLKELDTVINESVDELNSLSQELSAQATSLKNNFRKLIWTND